MATLQALVVLVCAAFATELAPAGAPGRLPVVPALYAPPALEWSRPLPNLAASPIEASLSRLSTLGVLVPALRADLPAAERLKTLAPVVEQLAQLGLDPRAFATHSAHDQDAALELALTTAKEDVAQKAYELVGRAKTLVWGETGYNKAKRDELYAVAAQLGELKEHYLELVPPAERDLVAQSELQARARFHDVQKALIEGVALPAADALAKGSPARGKESPAVPAETARPRSGSPAAAALLERMRATKSGWGQKDLDAVYRGYGFVMEEGGSHRKYYHPRYPQLWTMVARHNDLAPGYAQTALKLVAELERLQGPALPASAIGSEAAVPPLPRPSPESPVKKPEALVETPAPLESSTPAPERKKTGASPQKMKQSAAAPPAQNSLAPASPRPDAPKQETPPPAADAPKQLPVPHGWLENLRRMFGLD